MTIKANFFIYFLLLSLIGFSQNLKITEPEMIFVEGGSFRMGCLIDNDLECYSDEKPAVNVTLDDFWIGKYEITNAQYAEFLSEMDNQLQGGKSWYIMDKYALIEKKNDGLYLSKKGFENYPVNNINWYGAKAYTDWLSKKTNKLFRLPTEAEWEYAARGGNKSKGYIYSGSNNLEEVGWCFKYSSDSKTGWGFPLNYGTHPIGQKKPNELGIYDMTGNLKEWIYDAYDNLYKGGINPTGPKTGGLKITRGGSWDNKDYASRNTARNRSEAISSFTTNKGFRIVMDRNNYSKIDTIAKQNDFNGIIMVKKRNKVMYHKSFGTANSDKNISLSKNAPFKIASITKLFTSTIILQLLEEGKIDINHKISHYLPNYKGPAKDIVTLHQLLTHTSGIQSMEHIESNLEGFPEVYLNKYSTDELVYKYCSGELVSNPGTKFNYKNVDYVILGKIIERVEDDSYENVLKRRILKPLNMNNSGLITNFNVNKVNTEKSFPNGYTWDKETKAFTKDKDIYIQNYYSAAGMYSTVLDLEKFSDALFLNETLLSESSMQLLLQTYPEKDQYGYGLWVRFKEYDKNIIKVTERFGRILGINNVFTYVLNHDISIIIFSNTNKVSVGAISDFILKQLFEK